MNQQYMKSLLTRYLRNECSATEQEELFRYFRTPEGEEMLSEVMNEEANSIFQTTSETDPAISQRIFERLRGNMAKKEIPDSYSPRIRSWRTLQIAASFIGFLIMIGIGNHFYEKTRNQTVVTGPHQKRTVILPDGSRVIMNANSSIEYSKNWKNRDTRNIQLDGEAFFDVAHDEKRPFFVKTSKIEVKVLGTAFNVKSYAYEKTVETTLVRGKVIIKNLASGNEDSREIMLFPNERAVFSKASAIVNTSHIKPEDSPSWHNGHLVFEDEPVQIITQELEKWYKVKINVDEASKNCRFSLNIDGETLPEVLRLFEATTEVKSVINGKEVTLKGKMCE